MHSCTGEDLELYFVPMAAAAASCWYCRRAAADAEDGIRCEGSPPCPDTPGP